MKKIILLSIATFCLAISQETPQSNEETANPNEKISKLNEKTTNPTEELSLNACSRNNTSDEEDSRDAYDNDEHCDKEDSRDTYDNDEHCDEEDSHDTYDNDEHCDEEDSHKAYDNDEHCDEEDSHKAYDNDEHSHTTYDKKTKPKADLGLSVSAKLAYYRPQSSSMRSVLGNNNVIPSFEILYSLYNNFGIWLENGFFFKTVTTKLNNDDFSLKVIQIPLSIGISYFYTVCALFDVYIKIGPNWVYTYERLSVIADAQSTKTKHAFGGTFGVGAKLYSSSNWFLDIFFNYLYDKKKFNDPSNNSVTKEYFGGIQTGLGIGYTF